MTYTEISQPVVTIFERVTTEAQPGDFFRLPWMPTFRVIARVDGGDYIHFTVQAGSNSPEQWDVLKPEVELREQERNRTEAEEAETEMGEIVYESALQELEQALGFSLRPSNNDNAWLGEPIGANPEAIFGAFVPPSDEEMATYSIAENAYHNPQWTNEGCEF